MTGQRRLLHAAPNGDLWSLAREGADLVVLHEPAAASGGRPARIGLSAFLDGNPDAPERRAFLDLLGTLVEAGAAPVTGAPPEAGAAAAEPSPGEEAV